ncbi:ATPase AAA [Streptomyces sp. AS58]|uniref:ATP-binding protein n=1 Tax=Streptomyces sp. AS58 TaxID=1519489 RepID=UPI0006B04597|nr:ATP-binding protein [Streptomyces sp. AS58]KOV70693.1 ATPase AAA [Streptomyces sp. AS58]
MEGLVLLRGRCQDLVRARSADDPSADDPLRGLFLSSEHIGRLLQDDRARPAVRHDDAYGLYGDADGRLAGLAEGFGLTELDIHILLTALAPDVDRDFESLYGYLNDDVTRRCCTVALALDLAGLPPWRAAARARFHPGAPLRAGGLLTVEDEDRPLPSRALRVPERVIAHLLGDDTLDGALPGSVRLLPAGAPGEITGRIDPGAGQFAKRLGALLAAGPGVVHLREQRQGSAFAVAAAAVHAAGRRVLRCAPGQEDQHADRVAAALLREARLLGAGIVLGPLPARPEAWVTAMVEGAAAGWASGDASPSAARASDIASPSVAPATENRTPSVARASDPGAGRGTPVVIFGSDSFDPRWSPVGEVLCLDAPPDSVDTEAMWEAHVGDDAEEFDLPATVAPYRLSPDQIARAARTARSLAALEGETLGAAHVQQGARRQSAPTLDRHARRVSPAVGWTDLVLPDEPREQLEELLTRARHRERVLGQWGLRTGGGRGHGVVALFAGESGTGKTLAAEVVAGELGIDLYIVDLSAVVDKYVGETEKNLEKIFVEADRTDAVLLFDEADAVFGKRSEVKDSHDRYANLESAYLLQRLESFDGIALLTTNLRANIDEAFTRRLDLVVDFPFPDPAQRLALWRHSLAGVPCADGVDLDRCAREFELAGGSIRSAVITAAYNAVGRGAQVTTTDLLAGARREYRKAGRLVPGEVTW